MKASFYTVPAMGETLTSLYYRLSSDAYDLRALFVELILIGLCVNWCASVLHGTRGTRPLRGVLIILVVATLVVRVLVVQFGWVRLDLLYSYILYALAFIALIVFQPELRRAVIRIGDIRFRRRREPKSQLISALVKSAGYLSRNKHGALIAVERGVDLTGWAENGTMIRADVSPNLLNTVFFPNSPLHDLGVIIRGTRVLAANCQFPAAESDEIDAALGSRHLAAVGMSYETDALVLVISEETGVVSLADNGKLTRYLSLDDLAEELTTRLTDRMAKDREHAKERRMASAFWMRVRRVLVVVPLTVVIWYVADQATLAKDSVRIELDVRHNNPVYEVDVSGGAAVFSATLSGPARAIDRLRVDVAESPLRVTWILPKAYATPRTYSIRAREEIRAILEEAREITERGLTVAAVAIDELSFRVDERVMVSLPVRINAEGGPVRVAVERIDPPTVQVGVRRADRERLPRFISAKLSEQLEGLAPGEMRTFGRVPLAMPPGLSGATTLDPKEVTVTVRVLEQRRVIKNVSVRLFVSPEVLERYEVRKTDLNEWLIDVEVQGDEAVVEAPGSLDVQALVLVTGDVLPPAGQNPEEQFRTLDVIFLAPTGVSAVQRRGVNPTVRVTLVPRAGGTP